MLLLMVASNAIRKLKKPTCHHYLILIKNKISFKKKILSRNFTSNYENLHDYQSRLNECKYEIDNFSKTIPQV
jgi:hypothetical protein